MKCVWWHGSICRNSLIHCHQDVCDKSVPGTVDSTQLDYRVDYTIEIWCANPVLPCS